MQSDIVLPITEHKLTGTCTEASTDITTLSTELAPASSSSAHLDLQAQVSFLCCPSPRLCLSWFAAAMLRSCLMCAWSSHSEGLEGSPLSPGGLFVGRAAGCVDC